MSWLTSNPAEVRGEGKAIKSKSKRMKIWQCRRGKKPTLTHRFFSYVWIRCGIIDKKRSQVSREREAAIVLSIDWSTIVHDVWLLIKMHQALLPLPKTTPLPRLTVATRCGQVRHRFDLHPEKRGGNVISCRRILRQSHRFLYNHQHSKNINVFPLAPLCYSTFYEGKK